MIIGTGIAMAGIPGSGGRLDDRAPSAATPATAFETKEEGEGEGEEREEGPLVEVHEVAANLLYLLILLHIAGVVFETRRSGRQVVLAMLPFRR